MASRLWRGDGGRVRVFGVGVVGFETLDVLVDLFEALDVLVVDFFESDGSSDGGLAVLVIIVVGVRGGLGVALVGVRCGLESLSSSTGCDLAAAVVFRFLEAGALAGSSESCALLSVLSTSSSRKGRLELSLRCCPCGGGLWRRGRGRS